MKWGPAVQTVLLSLLMGCGGGDQTVSLETAQAQVRSALCERIYTCCSATDRAANPTIGKDRASCEPALDGESTALLADIQQSINAGRVIYHGDKMAACLARIRAASCDQAKMPPDDESIAENCEGVFEPTVPVGGACSDWWDCAGGWCEGDLGGLRDHCVALKTPGTECDENPECASGTCYARACTGAVPGSGNLCKIGTTDLGK